MKDIEWLKRKTEEHIEPYEEEDYLSYSAGCTDVAEIILELIDQLDEPEVLSDKWIDEHEQMVVLMNKGRDDFGNVYSAGTMVKGVPSGKLETLFVPKQEEVDRAYEDGYEKGKQHTFYKGYLEGLSDKENEPETVADVIFDFYKSLERFKEVLGTKVEELEE